METMKLNKVDVARRQLATALEMWFADGDPVAIHTLAMAAHDVASHVAKPLGSIYLTIYNRAVARAKELSKPTSEVHRRMKGPANFFKHADLDPDGEIAFRATAGAAPSGEPLVDQPHTQDATLSVRRVPALRSTQWAGDVMHARAPPGEIKKLVEREALATHHCASAPP